MSSARLDTSPIDTSPTGTKPSPVAALFRSTRAELLRLSKWPALWVMLGVWILLNITFGYVFDYISYKTDSSSGINEGIVPGTLLDGLLPTGVPEAAIQGLPMFGGAIMLILGALAAGSGYGWGTWKTVFTQGPSRASAFGGTSLALAIIVIGTMVATFVVDFGIASIITAVESEAFVWPSVADTASAFGSGLLISGMWVAGGVLIGTVTRGPALAVGLGLVWALAVENLLRGVANLLEPMEMVTDVLPGTAAGSLAGALGAAGQSDTDGTPGVQTILDGGPATLWLAAYLVVFTVVAALLTTRRDTI